MILIFPFEAELLEYLFKNPNRVIRREEILTQLWGENDYFLGRSLDVFISLMSKYLRSRGGNNNILIISDHHSKIVFIEFDITDFD